MTVTPDVLVESKYAENIQTTQFTQGLGKAILDKITATNVTAANAVISVHLVASGDTPDTDNKNTSSRILAPGESYEFPELTGHILRPGDFVSTLADTASAIVLRISGRLVT